MFFIRRGIEAVITGLTGNQFVPKAHEGSNPSLCARRFNFTLSDGLNLYFLSYVPLASAIPIAFALSSLLLASRWL